MKNNNYYSNLLVEIVYDMYKNPKVEFIIYTEPNGYGVKITDKETGAHFMENESATKDFEALSLELLLEIQKELEK